MAKRQTPLADRMRPTTLDEFVGQNHLVGEGQVLRNIIETGNLPSLIFWGPPGTGKTTLAKILANELDLPFYTLSAISSGVKDVRQVIEMAKKQGTALLLIDEIHRFSKSQQDSLLGAVEDGTIIMIGATTENPSFEVISALLSRSQVYTLESLTEDDLISLLHRAIEKDEELSEKDIDLRETKALLQLSDGDARRMLNLLELTAESYEEEEQAVITDEAVTQSAQRKVAMYDKEGEQHYDIISAFIKSIRGSDPNAGVYWLARMIEGGEDPKFIARRLLILASEDIGNANPNALLLANSCFQSVEVIGYPECRIILSQAVVYLATSPKSNSSYMAINEAQSLVNETGDLDVPLHIRNAPTKLMKDLDYGKGYKYAHSYKGHFEEQEYLPEAIQGKKLFEPGDNTREEEMRKRLREWWGKKYGY